MSENGSPTSTVETTANRDLATRTTVTVGYLDDLVLALTGCALARRIDSVKSMHLQSLAQAVSVFIGLNENQIALKIMHEIESAIDDLPEDPLREMLKRRTDLIEDRLVRAKWWPENVDPALEAGYARLAEDREGGVGRPSTQMRANMKRQVGGSNEHS